MLSLIVILLASYFLGSIPGALWSSKALHGVDIRNYGSHNCGATNAFRVVGWQAGALATVVDFGKGLVSAGPVASLVRIDPLPALGIFGWNPEVVIGLLAGLMAVVGHMYPIFARFNGGKGVNTAAGMLCALAPITMAITLAVFAVVLFSSRYVS
ncbi:MAG: acyl-phosphate glycerol 3-phosphate acyltransferase, partial [Bacteroidetes bacterium QH_6_64_77]